MHKTTFLCAAAFCGILAAGSQAQAQILGGGGGLGGGIGGGLGGLSGSAAGSINGAGSINRPDVSGPVSRTTDTVRSTKSRVKDRADNVRDRATDATGRVRDTARSVDGSASVNGSANAGTSGASVGASVSADPDTSMVGDTTRRAKGAVADTRQRATRTTRGAVSKAKGLRPDVDASAEASGSAGADVRR